MGWAESFFCFEALPAFTKTVFCSNHRACSKLASLTQKSPPCIADPLLLEAAALLQMKKTPAIPHFSCPLSPLLFKKESLNIPGGRGAGTGVLFLTYTDVSQDFLAADAGPGGLYEPQASFRQEQPSKSRQEIRKRVSSEKHPVPASRPSSLFSNFHFQIPFRYKASKC